jgi:hypothetical protein
VSVKKVKLKPAFPGRSDAMGYESGLTKVEYFALHIYAQGGHTADQAVEAAKSLLEKLAKDSV